MLSLVHGVVVALQACQLLILYAPFPLEGILQISMRPANLAFIIT